MQTMGSEASLLLWSSISERSGTTTSAVIPLGRVHSLATATTILVFIISGTTCSVGHFEFFAIAERTWRCGSGLGALRRLFQLTETI